MMRLYGSKLLLLGTAAILLGGCGGGGGGGSGDETDPPRAVDDTTTTQEDNSVTIDVTANDTLTNSDETIDKTSVAIKTQPAHGSAAVQDGSGKVVYTPNANYYGSDSFTYTVKDNEGEESNVATVAITITAVSDGPPVAVDDSATTNEGSSVTIDVTANDTDPDGNGTIDKSTVTITQPANGSATVNATTGVVTYTPNAGFNGPDSFTYTVKDDTGAVSTKSATVTITVKPVDSGGPAAVDDTASTLEDTLVNIDVTANDTDPDGANTIDKTSIKMKTAPQDGTATPKADGTIDYTPNTGFFGTDTFTYTVKDDAGNVSNPATVTVTVTATKSGNKWDEAEWDKGHWAP